MIPRARAITKLILDVDGKTLHEGDYCEFIDWGGNLKKGRIEDVGTYTNVEYAFCYDEGNFRSVLCSVTGAKNIKILKRKDEGCSNENGINKIIGYEDLFTPLLVSMGFNVKEHYHGYLINDKYIIAGSQDKWRKVGKNKWYRFKTIESLKEIFSI